VRFHVENERESDGQISFAECEGVTLVSDSSFIHKYISYIQHNTDTGKFGGIRFECILFILFLSRKLRCYSVKRGSRGLIVPRIIRLC